MKKTLVGITLLFLSLSTTLHAQEVQEITYHNGGNYKAWISYPNANHSLPTIIYNYDEYWDWAQNERAIQRGYDLKSFMQMFNRWGFICMIPIERYRKINALRGAVEFVKELPQSNGKVHLVGLSEGGFLSLLTPEKSIPVTSITLLSPTSIYTPYMLTNNQIPNELKQLNIPILYIASTCDPMWKMNTTKDLIDLLKKANLNVRYLEYSQTHIWFWNPENAFMQDIYEFITGERVPIKDLL